ncbi:MAG: hypothetical protein H0W68_12665, partial [Gemmatimonadaceae bacterium]|nr:hypothetical protein [Gemmatimonadaceae bacterium]
VLWSSWVELHPEKATSMGIERGDLVEVKTAYGTVVAPAYLYLGIRPDTVALALGQGHASTATLGNFNPKDDRSPVQWGYGRYARGVGARVQDLLASASDGAGRRTRERVEDGRSRDARLYRRFGAPARTRHLAGPPRLGARRRRCGRARGGRREGRGQGRRAPRRDRRRSVRCLPSRTSLAGRG